jgi:spore germination cell wall hydrolase CwlJ-like protein
MSLIKQLIAAFAISYSLPNYAYAQPSNDFYKQATCLATNIYFEARGEPIKGQIAVAMVTLNRVADESFPDTICDVVYQGSTTRGKCQFGWYCDGKSDNIPKHSPEKRIAMLIAITVMNIPIRDPTKGALYFTSSLKKHPKNAIKIGDHFFY